MSNEIIWDSAWELRNAVLNGDLSVLDIIEKILEHVERVNPHLNAIIYLDEDRVREEAEEADRIVRKGVEKPLLGVPITLKDNIFTKDMPTTFGSKLYKDYVPDEDAILVERLKNAGAIILGKTNLPELGLLAITDNPLFGVTRNPWDITRTPGGSSGGAAAAVASGMGPIGIGNDAGGSIRIPSSFCGVYGFKPSPNLIPSYPRLPIFQGISVDGPITRYVLDAALILDVISGPDPRDRRSLCLEKKKFFEEMEYDLRDVKIAYSRDLGYAMVNEEVDDIVEKAVYRFEEIGLEVQEIDLEMPDIGEELSAKAIIETVAYLKSIGKYEEWYEVAFKPYRKYVSLLDDETIYHRYVGIEQKIDVLWRSIRVIFKEYDFLVTPTVAVPPFKLEEGLGPKEIRGVRVGPLGWMPFTYPFNFTGQPAANIPAGSTKEGLPIGMQIVGRPYDDLRVLIISRIYEEAFPWQSRKPSIVG